MPNVFTYSGDPSASPLDMLRSLLGDTDSTAVLMYDAEITAHYNAAGQRIYLAASRIAKALAGKFARLVDVKIDDASKSNSQLSKQFLAMSREFIQQNALEGVGGYAGGTSRADKRNVESNTDRTLPSFDRKTDVPVTGTVGIAASDPHRFFPDR